MKYPHLDSCKKNTKKHKKTPKKTLRSRKERGSWESGGSFGDGSAADGCWMCGREEPLHWEKPSHSNKTFSPLKWVFTGCRRTRADTSETFLRARPAALRYRSPSQSAAASRGIQRGRMVLILEPVSLVRTVQNPELKLQPAGWQGCDQRALPASQTGAYLLLLRVNNVWTA